jgi:GT2 family glycosyltransferase
MRVCAVLVTYKRPLVETESHQSLAAAFAEAGEALKDFELVVYDNSPTPQSALPPTPYRLRYRHDPSNGGLVAAYNHALAVAAETGADWLLLLDQDSRLPRDYFAQFREAHRWLESRTVAIAPRIRSAGRMVSPVAVPLGVPNLAPMPPDLTGLCDREIAVINSGLFVRTAFVRELGGFPSSYWLDAVDLWFSAQAYARGRNVYVMPCWVEHALSVSAVREIGPVRWKSILSSEVQCCLDTRGPVSRVLQAGVMYFRAAELIKQRSYGHAWPTAYHATRLLVRAPLPRRRPTSVTDRGAGR